MSSDVGKLFLNFLISKNVHY